MPVSAGTMETRKESERGRSSAQAQANSAGGAVTVRMKVSRLITEFEAMSGRPRARTLQACLSTEGIAT